MSAIGVCGRNHIELGRSLPSATVRLLRVLVRLLRVLVIVLRVLVLLCRRHWFAFVAFVAFVVGAFGIEVGQKRPRNLTPVVFPSF